MSNTQTCAVCGCDDIRGGAMHAVVAALHGGDVDRALDLGLLELQPCSACAPACHQATCIVRDARLQALAARERFRARAARLEARALARAQARAAPATATRNAPPLPPAAAAALARAKARAAGRTP